MSISNLDLKISLDSPDCSNLIFNELTGIYTTSNLTGWGAPNDTLGEVISATLFISTPSGTGFAFNPLLSGFPTNSTVFPYTISYASLGLPTGLVDGVYTATYTVITSVTSVLYTYRVSNQFLINCNLECCVDKMLLDIDDFDCDCNEDKKDKYLTALSALYSIEKAKDCGDIVTANNLFSIANKLCNNLGCQNCKDSNNRNFY